MVDAQSAGRPAASASDWAIEGKMKSLSCTIPGRSIATHGDSASFLSRTASLKTALMTR
jgi:hypothetical protein